MREIPHTAPYTIESINLFNEILEAPVSQTISGLMELAHDKVIRRRREQLYLKKEFKILGIKSIDDLDDEYKRGLELLIDKNIGDDEGGNHIN